MMRVHLPEQDIVAVADRIGQRRLHRQRRDGLAQRPFRTKAAGVALHDLVEGLAALVKSGGLTRFAIANPEVAPNLISAEQIGLDITSYDADWVAVGVPVLTDEELDAFVADVPPLDR